MKHIVLCSIAALLLSCGNSSSTSGKGNNNTDKQVAAAGDAAPAADASGGTEIKVTLTGGANDGTFTATSAEPTCSMGLTGDKSFGNQYSENGKTDKELSSVQLIIENYDEAKNGTSNFNVMFGFGKLFGGNTYSLDPKKGAGSGKATISESGHSRTVTIEGKTDKGVAIKATISCKVVQAIVDGQLKPI